MIHRLAQLAKHCLLGLAAAVLIANTATAQQASPSQVIDGLHQTLLQAMQNAKTLHFRGRYDLLAPVVTRTFDLPRMAQVAVGRYWANLNENQRTHLKDIFSQFTAAEYATRFSGYSGQKFTILGETESERGSRLVKTTIGKPGDDPVEIVYLMMQDSEQNWRVVDVFLKGTISQLAEKRSQYVAVLDRQGFQGLITALEAKLKELAND
ncbi:MAG: ABC transporter substrate-binding protein [Alphaproteobacteria bacterium]